MSELTDKIVNIATSYLDKKEITGNKGWLDKDFQQKMIDVGWQFGNSWCALFAELVWKEAYTRDSPFWSRIDRLFSASATATSANFIASKDFITGKVPKEGAVVLWRHGNGWQGHAGIVLKVIDSTHFETAEGNSDSEGGREGIEVAFKKREIGLPFKAKGLNFICFVYPTETPI